MAEMTMVERVARAIAMDGGWELPNDMTLPYTPNSRIGKAMSSARAAIEAMREPTAGMKRAGMVALNSSGVDNVYETDAPECFTSMIDAALKETA